MPDFFNFVEGIWDTLKFSAAKTRAQFSIKRDHVANSNQSGGSFEPQKHYFQIIVNEMFLAHERDWFVNYSPMAFVATSYIYDKKLETLPMVIGPGILKKFGVAVPQGVLFQNTPASGMYPYQGGSLTLVVILNKLMYRNNADRLLHIIENISSAVGPALALSAYLPIASAVLSGVESLLGLQETIPVLGYHLDINPNIGQVFEPTYYVLIDDDARQIQQEHFWVRNSQLYYGVTMDSAQPYRQRDFILLSIAQGDKRTDERTLPFYPLWETTRDLASQPTGEGDHFWKEAKHQFNTLKRALVNSPDLTVPDSKRLRDLYFNELARLRQEAIEEGKLGKGHLSAIETELRQMADDLDKLD